MSNLAWRVSLAASFICGVLEFRSDVTLSQVDDHHYEAYDKGRDLAHRLTLRRCDPSHTTGTTRPL